MIVFELESEHLDISIEEREFGFLDVEATDFASVIRFRLKKDDIEELGCKLLDWVDSINIRKVYI